MVLCCVFQNGLNALHLASKEGHINIVTELMKRGANVDATTKVGQSCSPLTRQLSKFMFLLLRDKEKKSLKNAVESILYSEYSEPLKAFF